MICYFSLSIFTPSDGEISVQLPIESNYFVLFNLVLVGFSCCIWSISPSYIQMLMRVWRLHSSAYICRPVLFCNLTLVSIIDWNWICIWMSSHNSWANRIPLLHLICVMKSFWSGWKDDTNIQKEKIAITVICIFVSNRRLGLCKCKRKCLFLLLPDNQNMLKRSAMNRCTFTLEFHIVLVNRYCMCGILAVMIHRCHVTTSFSHSWHCP